MVSVAILYLILVFETLNKSDNSDGLNCLAESHLVCQDSVQICLIEAE